MPKDLIAADWVQTPCLFLQRVHGNVCGLCERPFTFMNRPRHCAYCGRVYHRKDCSKRVRILSHRACYYCDDYRNLMRDKLSNGDSFSCVGDCAVSDVFISLCEKTAELVLHWKSRGVKETVDLLQVELRKGFTHSGHLHNGDYEPLKSMSLFINESQGGPRVMDLKSQSAWNCQLWVDGLKSAQYVYRCMLDQDRSRRLYLDKGVKLPQQPHWFFHYYLPDPTDSLTTSLSTPINPTTQTTPCSQSAPKPIKLVQTTTPSKPLRAPTPSKPVHALSNSHHHGYPDSGYSSEHSIWSTLPTCSRMPRTRSVQPHSPIKSPPRGLGSLHSPPKPYTQSWHSQVTYSRASLPHKSHTITTHTYHRSTYGLPYSSSPVSTLCRCHDYEIIPSRSVVFSSSLQSTPNVRSPEGNKCCGDCVNICRIAQDLDNL